ncbi:MAG: HAD-IIA family hydrolase [Candidatus Nanohalobium sp.]
MEFDEIRTFFFDIEKTLINWNDTIIGAEDLIMSLRESGKKVRFHTDNTLLTRKGYAKKLRSMEIQASEDEIITSGYVAAQTLAEKDVTKAYVIGEEGLIKELEEEDIDFSQDAENVVVGLDRQFNYNKLKRAKKILDEEDSDLYLCSQEKTFRKSSDERPHQLPINRSVEVFGEGNMVGKPSDAFRRTFKDYFSYYPDNSMFIGDRLADIETGNRLGMTTAAVLSGEITEEKLKEADEMQRPDYALSSLAKLRKRVL